MSRTTKERWSDGFYKGLTSTEETPYSRAGAVCGDYFAKFTKLFVPEPVRVFVGYHIRKRLGSFVEDYEVEQTRNKSGLRNWSDRR